MRTRGAIFALIMCLGCAAGSLTGQKTLHVPSQYKTIAGALAAAADYDTVLVGPGCYRENLVIGIKRVHLRSVAGPHRTIIDGGGQGPVISCPSGWGRTIDGFTIQNGSNPQGKGGGIFAGAGNPLVIRNNIIRNNRAGEGGGVYTVEGCPTVITGNRIENNIATAVGGGIRIAGDGPHTKVAHNIVIGNKCTLDGGGIYAHGNGMFTLYIDHNLIVENEAGRDGGGLHCFDGLIYSNIIRGNRASRYGGGLYMPICGVVGAWGMENCTFVGNSALGGGGAVSENFDMFRPRVWTNCIFWNNRALSGPEIMVGVLKPPTWWHSWLHLDHCVVSGGLASIKVSSKSTLRWGGGMMTKDPRFVHESGGDLHLTWGSPCIDAGNPKVPHTVDFEDDPFRGVVDIGADEFAPHFYQVGEARPGQLFGLRMIGAPGHRVYWGASANLRSPPSKIPGAGFLHLGDPFLTWPGGTLGIAGVQTLPFHLPWWFPTPTRFTAQALIGSKLSNPVEVWIW